MLPSAQTDDRPRSLRRAVRASVGP
jgi:hypothetical protein